MYTMIQVTLARGRARNWVWAGLTSLALVAASGARAQQVLEWDNPAGGDASVPGNWNPRRVPTASDVVAFDTPGAYTVSFDDPVSAVFGLDVEDGPVSFDVSSSLDILSAATIGTSGLAELFIRSGSLRFGSVTVVGSGLGNAGTLEIDGAGAVWNGDLEIGKDEAEGTLWVTDGGSGVLRGSLVCGNGDDSRGVVHVFGRKSVAPYTPSTLTTEDAIDPVILGVNGGTGILWVQAGAMLDLRTSLILGGTPDSQGGLRVLGDDDHSSTARVDGDLLVGADATGGPGGSGDVIVMGGGAVLEVTGTVRPYDADASTGFDPVRIYEGGLLVTRSLDLESAQALRIYGGEVIVAGGMLDVSPSNSFPLVISGVPDQETRFVLDDGATGHLRCPSYAALIVGSSTPGQLDVRNGSELFVHDRGALVGLGPGSSGILQVEEGSTLVVDEELLLGIEGYGALNLLSGGEAWLNEVVAGTAPGGVGGLIIDTDASAHVAGDFALGGTPDAPSGGLGAALVGGELWLSQTGTSGTVWPEGEVALNGGTLHLGGALHVHGGIQVIDGASSGGRIVLEDDGRIEGRGDLNTRVLSQDATTEIVATGDLALGRANAALGFGVMGLLDVGAHEVTLRDADSAMVATVAIDGGTLRLPPTPAVLREGYDLTGRGTIHGTLRPRGRVLAEGSGLAFGGTLLGTGTEMSGSAIRFLSESAFVGEGAIEASVYVEEGATITPTGTFSLGEPGAGTRVTIDGDLDVGSQLVALYVDDVTRVNGRVDLDGGALLAPVDVPTHIEADGIIRGNGLIGGTLRVAGTMAPGHSAGNLEPWELVLDRSARLEIELGDHGAGEWDSVSVGTRAFLGGTLDLKTLPGFDQTSIDTFLVLTSLQLDGTFDEVTINGTPAQGRVEIAYADSNVYVITRGVVVDVAESPSVLPVVTALHQNAPNPFNPVTTIGYSLAEAGHVSLRIFDVRGRMVRELVNATRPAANHRVSWNGRDAGGRALASGTYFYVLEAPGVRQKRRMLLAR